MNKNKSPFLSFLVALFLLLPSFPVMAWDCDWDFCDCFCQPLDLSVEGKVAYFRPCSKRVRDIYGSGWADYQLEISKGIFCDWKIWAGVNGFSRKGESLGFHDHTRLQLIPVNVGLKYYFPCPDNFKIYLGGAVSYSFLSIRDHTEYLHRRTEKSDWGGLVQAGITYNYFECAYVSIFADYFYQKFDFHSNHISSGYGSEYYYESGYIERRRLDMCGYKLGVGLGYTF